MSSSSTPLIWAFLRLQLSAAAFGIALLAMIVASKIVWTADAPLYRYDALLIGALALQALMLSTGWESWEEAKAIFAFHVVGTVMEYFKIAAGAWIYPEPSVAQILGVPLFTGFMYSAVGSYIARCWRGLDLSFNHFPPISAASALAAAIYVNFFAHHYVWDWRLLLFALSGWMFWRTMAAGALAGRPVRFPVLAFFLGVGVLIWIAENIATWANIWLYPAQMDGWEPVSAAKIGSWYLLMIVSFVLVALIHRPDRAPAPQPTAP